MRTRHYRMGERLREFPLFADCRESELAAADPLFTDVSLRQGHELIRFGERGSEFFVIAGGETVVSTRGYELARVGAGGFVGEVALIDGTPRNADVAAVTPIRALVQGAREFRTLLRCAPTVAERLAAAAEQRR